MFKSAKKVLTLVFIILICSFQVYAQKSVSGIVTEEIKTKDGTIKIIRTDKLPMGKTISGTVIAEPESDNPKKQEKQLAKLSLLILKIGDAVISNNGIFTTTLPEAANIPLQVLEADGNLIEEISLELTEPVENLTTDLPKTLITDKTEKIAGNFSGDINDANLLVDEVPANIIAGNNSEIFFETPDLAPGQHDLTLTENQTEISKKINVVDYTLKVGRTNLNRGESTKLDVVVSGLEGIEEEVILEVENRTPTTINLEGGIQQTIVINPDDARPDGTWQKQFDIQSNLRGEFNIFTELKKPTKTETQKPTVAGVGRATGRTEQPEQADSITGNLAKKMGGGIAGATTKHRDSKAAEGLGAIAEGAKKVIHPKVGTKAGASIKDAARGVGQALPIKEREPEMIDEKVCDCSRAEIISIWVFRDGNPFTGSVFEPGLYRFQANVMSDCPADCEQEIRGSWIIDFIPDNGQSIIQETGMQPEIEFRAEQKGRLRIRYTCRVLCDGKPCPMETPFATRDYVVSPCKCENCEVVQAIRVFNSKTNAEIRGDSIEWGVRIRVERPQIRNLCDPECSPEEQIQMRYRVQYRNGGRFESSWSNQLQTTVFQGPGVVFYEAIYRCYCDGELCVTDTITKILHLKETNDCCDRLRNAMGELKFNVGNGGFVSINNNRLSISIDGQFKAIYFDFNLESVFCNLSNNQIVSQLTSESAAYSSGGDSEFMNSEDISMEHSTDSEGRDPNYTLSFGKQVLINGELQEIFVSVSIDSRTCNYDIQLLYDEKLYENAGLPSYTSSQLATEILNLGNPANSFFWNRSLFILGQISKMQEHNIPSQQVLNQLISTLRNAIARLDREGRINNSNRADINNLRNALQTGDSENIALSLIMAMNHFL